MPGDASSHLCDRHNCLPASPGPIRCTSMRIVLGPLVAASRRYQRSQITLGNSEDAVKVLRVCGARPGFANALRHLE